MAAELVVGALLEVIFDRLASRLVLDYFRGRKLDEQLLNMLKVKLLSVNAVVDDAELKQNQNPPVRDWLFKVKDAVFDAEDLLDEIHYEALKCQMEAESKTASSKVWNFFSTFFVSSFDKEIESRMKQVLDNLEFLSSLKGDLGLKEVIVVGLESGSDYDKEIIFNWLTSDADNCNQPSILSVIGMGGMGKTTLAQHVYNDRRIEQEAKFDIKAWVCVSDDFDVLRVTREILQAFTKSKNNDGNLEMVHGKLKENLTGKRFLLVLDDVWNEKREKWEA
ncbi:putative disease resistance RPP13-like protein 1, partial [Mucuna pruriens]